MAPSALCGWGRVTGDGPQRLGPQPGFGRLHGLAHVYRHSEGRDYDLVKKGSYDSSGGEYKVEMLQDGRAQCAFKGACTMPRSAAARMWQWGAGSRCGAPRPRHQ